MRFLRQLVCGARDWNALCRARCVRRRGLVRMPQYRRLRISTDVQSRERDLRLLSVVDRRLLKPQVNRQQLVHRLKVLLRNR